LLKSHNFYTSKIHCYIAASRPLETVCYVQVKAPASSISLYFHRIQKLGIHLPEPSEDLISEHTYTPKQSPSPYKA